MKGNSLTKNKVNINFGWGYESNEKTILWGSISITFFKNISI